MDAQLAPPCSLGLPPITATAVPFAPEFYHPLHPSSTLALLADSNRFRWRSMEFPSMELATIITWPEREEKRERERKKEKKEQ